MGRTFFVMLNTQRGVITPLIDDETEEVAIFANDTAARKAADDNVLGYAFGFEVFEAGRE
jgi:hypothetical protein